MSHTTGRHRAPGRYNPVSEIGQIVTQAGTPLAKGSAVLAASGGLVAAIAIPAQAATADDADTAPAKQTASAPQAAAPATIAVTAPKAAGSSTTSTSSFGTIDVEPVAKPTGPTPYQLRMREERAAERAAAAEERRERAAAAAEREERQAEQAEQAQTEQAEQEQAEQQSAPEQESTPERTESAPSRSQERQAPSAGSSSSSSSSSSTAAATPKSSPAPSSSGSSDVISIAKQYIGTPYVFGGSSPAGFDCSGFTQYVFAKAGKSLPRVTTAQQAAATPVSNPQPGDLVFFGSPSYHVGIYLGNGQMIDAPSSGKSVSIRPVFDGVSGYGRV
ncbi:MAG: C40 family peptidase [Janibacter sp.]